MSAKGKVDTKKLGAVAQEVMEDSKTGVDVHGWKLRSHKGGILSSADEKKFAKELKIKTPGMLFGHSFLRCVHEESGVNIEFDARGALSMVGEADPHLVVKSAKHWQRKKERNDIQVLEGASDWTFSTKYGGTVFRRKDGKESKVKICKDGCRGIDYDKLMRRDLNILFWKEVILFEDELDDNGQASYTVRVRAMSDFFYILARFFLRIDGVIFRVYDTRYYHEYNTNYVVREQVHREDEYEKVVRGEPDISFVRDSDLVAQKLRTVSRQVEEIRMGSDGE